MIIINIISENYFLLEPRWSHDYVDVTGRGVGTGNDGCSCE